MHPYLLILMGLIMALPACGRGLQTPAPVTPTCDMSDRFDYFQGHMKMRSPDGKTPYGPPKNVLVKRHIQPNSGTITEYTWHGGHALVTTMTRRVNTGIFDAVDNPKTFTGTLTYGGPVWCLSRWQYTVNLGPKGNLKGTGWMEHGQMRTDKMFYGPKGKAAARIREHLSPMTRAAFDAVRKAQ
jgi:hypothetical protein